VIQFYARRDAEPELKGDLELLYETERDSFLNISFDLVWSGARWPDILRTAFSARADWRIATIRFANFLEHLVLHPEGNVDDANARLAPLPAALGPSR
jgi:hypothetical protein